jgi:amidase
MTEPCDLPAVTARALIGKRKLSPVELMDSCIRRIEEIDPAVNAVIARSFETARATAQDSEAAVMRGDALGALHGLPLGVKDLIDAKGLPTSFGSVLFADNIATEDEAVVAMLKRAGAIVVGKTNVPEWGAGGNTRNALRGATGNPFDPERSAAGSSGGSAVALATGMVPLATGSDTGGSVRNPAAFCGVVGFPPLARADRQQQPQHGLAADLAAWTDGKKRIRRVPDAFLHAGSRRARSAVGHPSRRRNARARDLPRSATD